MVLGFVTEEKRPIECKWVYKIKYKSYGSVEWHKARVVAKGFTQLEGIDYVDTFYLVAKNASLKVLLALATINNWHMIQLEISISIFGVVSWFRTSLSCYI